MLSGMAGYRKPYQPDAFEEEEWNKVRIGYLSDADGRVWEDAFHTPRAVRRLKFSHGKRRAWQRRVMAERVQLLDRKRVYINTRREVVVKALSRAKTSSCIENMLRYIEKSREWEGEIKKPVLHDEFGRPLKPGEWGRILQSWGLSDEGLEVSTQGSQASQASATPQRVFEKGKRCFVLAHHLVVSIDRREEDPEDVLERLNEAAYASIDQIFTQHGHRVLWAIHANEPAHPHVHIVVKALSDDGRRLRFDKQGDYLHYLRIVFAEHLTRHGMVSQATRRIDRPEQRQVIIRGDVPLRQTNSNRERIFWTSRLRDRAPNWWALTQSQQWKILRLERERKWRGEPGLWSKVKSISKAWHEKYGLRTWPQQLDPYLKELAVNARHVFKEPKRALTSLIKLMVDGENNNAYAAWLIVNAPSQFGQLRNDQPNHHDALQRMSETIVSLKEVLSNYRMQQVPLAFDECPVTGPERNIARVHYQRKAVASMILRVAAYCRDELEDECLAYRIRWELVDSLRTVGSAMRHLTPQRSGQKSNCPNPMISHDMDILPPNEEPGVQQHTSLTDSPSGKEKSRNARRRSQGMER